MKALALAVGRLSGILYFTNIGDLPLAGTSEHQSESFLTFLRPFLERRDVTLIGESTVEAFRGIRISAGRAVSLEDAPGMQNFSVIPLAAPDQAATRAILDRIVDDRMQAIPSHVEDEALTRCVQLTDRFQRGEAFPGKAIRLLEEALRSPDTTRPYGGAIASAPSPTATSTHGRRFSGEMSPDVTERFAPATISSAAVGMTFARLTGLPAWLFADDHPITPADVRAAFTDRIVGQEPAVEAVAKLICLVKAELNDPQRPLGVLLFVGPTGSGKTLLATTLAAHLFGREDALVRLDMSEYGHAGGASLFADHLADKLYGRGFAVVLLDEIEKAAVPVFDLFLQAFDAGRLTTAAGFTIDLRNTIIIMTSNLGSDLTLLEAEHPMGFVAGTPQPKGHEERLRQSIDSAVRALFRPEFVNRIDDIVHFQALDRAAMRGIVQRELRSALRRGGVERRRIDVLHDTAVLDLLTDLGFDTAYGARPLQRAIKEHVLVPLAELIAARPDLASATVEVRTHGGRFTIVPECPGDEPWR